VARLWNFSEERGKEWPVDGASSVIDFASSFLGTVEAKTFDFDHNSHGALAERGGYSENHTLETRGTSVEGRGGEVDRCVEHTLFTKANGQKKRTGEPTN
jgi:hypothetical protein